MIDLFQRSATVLNFPCGDFEGHDKPDWEMPIEKMPDFVRFELRFFQFTIIEGDGNKKPPEGGFVCAC